MWDTNRRLDGGHLAPASFKTLWPAVPGDPALAFGYHKAELPLGLATPDAIDRLERCCMWPARYLEDVRDRRIILAITAGVSGRSVARADGRDEAVIRRRYRKALFTIACGVETARHGSEN